MTTNERLCSFQPLINPLQKDLITGLLPIYAVWFFLNRNLFLLTLIKILLCQSLLWLLRMPEKDLLMPKIRCTIIVLLHHSGMHLIHSHHTGSQNFG